MLRKSCKWTLFKCTYVAYYCIKNIISTDFKFWKSTSAHSAQLSCFYFFQKACIRACVLVTRPGIQILIKGLRHPNPTVIWTLASEDSNWYWHSKCACLSSQYFRDCPSVTCATFPPVSVIQITRIQTQSCHPVLNPANQLYSHSLAHKSLHPFT